MRTNLVKTSVKFILSEESDKEDVVGQGDIDEVYPMPPMNRDHGR